ncbi:MAG: MATE family efflux transporter, partial [Beijerinckiaceae bacterium]
MSHPTLSPSPWLTEARATLTLAWPIVLTNVAQIAMTTTDVMILGRLGPEALAAGGLGANLYFALLIFGIGVTAAVSPMLARTLGSERFALREVRRTVRQGFWLSVMMALPMWAVFWFAAPVLRLIGQDAALSEQAQIYMRGMMWGALPFFFYLVLRHFVAALERPRAALAVTAFGVAFNALANYVLVFGHFGFPALGIFGSGIATSLSNLLLFLGMALIVTTDRRFRRYHLFGNFWRADRMRLRGLWSLGLPIGAALTFEVTIFNAAAFLMGLIGTNALAAHMIAIQIASFTFMIPMGIAQAATVRVGLADGAGDRDGVTRAGWCAFALAMAVMLVTAMIMIFAPLLPVRAFVDIADAKNAEVVRLAISFLLVAGFFQIFDGAQVMGAGLLRGLHDTRIPMLFAALGYWGIGLPLGAVLAFTFQWQGMGIWIGLATGLAVVAAMMLGRWMRRDVLRLGMKTAT